MSEPRVSGSSVSPSPTNDPDFARRPGDDAAVLQVAHEPGLVNRVDRPQPHRNCGETPEVRHQPGVRIGGKAGSVAQLVAEVFQFLLGEPALQVGARVHARRSVALEIDEVARLVTVVGPEKMVEADFQQRGDGRIGRNVSADAGILLVLAMHHGQRVPPDQALDAALQGAVARVGFFLLGPNGVGVGGVQLHRDVHPGHPGALRERFQDAHALACAFRQHHLVESFNPLCDFFYIGLQRNCWFHAHNFPVSLGKLANSSSRSPEDGKQYQTAPDSCPAGKGFPLC